MIYYLQLESHQEWIENSRQSVAATEHARALARNRSGADARAGELDTTLASLNDDLQTLLDASESQEIMHKALLKLNKGNESIERSNIL